MGVVNRTDNLPLNLCTNNCTGDVLARWVSEHGAALRGFLRGAVRNADLADDLLQEVFCRAWSARAAYVDTGNARAYLLRIADRLVCDHYRRHRTETEYIQKRARGFGVVDAEVAAGPGELAARNETDRQLAVAIESLSPVQRRILLLRYYGDLSFQEIAEMTAIPLNTALSHCRRGLLALRQLLKEESL